MSSVYIGIDVGTTKVKTVLFTKKGYELGLASKKSKCNTSTEGYEVQDMNKLWEVVSQTLKEALKSIDSSFKIEGVGVTGQGDGLWMIDENGNPVKEANLWVDGRGRDFINKWKDKGILSESGRTVFSGSPLTLSAWYYKNKPEIMEKADKIMFCKDWIKYCLTGNVVTDASDLSDASLIDVIERSYSEELLEKYDMKKLKELLPPKKSSTQIIGQVTKEASRMTGLPKGTPVVNGMIDVSACALGVGATEQGSAASIVGTTVYNEVVLDSQNLDSVDFEDNASIICHALDNRWLLTQGTMMGTPNLDWFLEKMYLSKDKLNNFSFDKITEKIKDIPIGSKGLIFHPYLGEGGERAPFSKPSAAGQFFGIKHHHTKDHFLRAVFEGIALSMKDCYEHFPELPNYIRLTGGGSYNEFWCQMFSDCLGIPIEVPIGNEHGALGAAITAAVGTGHFSNYQEAVKEMVNIKKAYNPIMKNVKKYQKIYELYTELYNNSWDSWDKREKLINELNDISE
jgi:xylulokinase/L-xylulokinase